MHSGAPVPEWLTNSLFSTGWSKRAIFIPNKVVCLYPADGQEAKAIEALVPFVKDQGMLNGKATAYVCQNYHCQFPTNDLEKFKKLLQ